MFAEDIIILTFKTILWAIPVGLLINLMFPYKK